MDKTEPPPPPPPPPPVTTTLPPPEAEEEEPQEVETMNGDSEKPRTSSALDNFKNFVINVAFSCTKTHSLSSTLQQHLDHLLPSLDTPDHPPYAAMIQEAIEQLNEEQGSGKEAISTFIKENYHDLPWAHDGMLEHHLNILCTNSHLVQAEDGRYLVSHGALDAPTSLTSPSVDMSYNSFSSSSSSSGSGSVSEYSIEVLGKRKLVPKKQKEARRRKRIRQSGEDVFAGRTKSSVTRLYRASEEDDLLSSSDERESNEVESESYTDSDFDEKQFQKKKKKARKNRKKRQVNGKTGVARRGRGRPPKNVLLEVSEKESCLMIKDKQEPKSFDEQNMDSEQLSSPDEVSKKKDTHDYVNEVFGEETKLLQLLQESASGENLPGQEDEDEEAYKQIELLVGHAEATTKKQGRSDIGKSNEGVDSKEVTPKQSLISEKGKGKRRGRPRKQLVFEDTNPVAGDMVAIQVQNVQGEVPKKRRGRPPKTEKQVQQKPLMKNDAPENECKLQDPNEEGKELKKKRVRKNSVPGRKRGRPPKNPLSRQVQIVQEQLQTFRLQDIEKKSMQEENDPEQRQQTDVGPS